MASLAVGEVPPLSRLAMYAGRDARPETHVFQLRVAGAPVRPADLDRFQGLDTLPFPPVPTGMRWWRDGLQAHVARHRDPSGAPGPLQVAYGYVRVGWDDGRLAPLDPFVVLDTGTAWPR